MKILIIEDIDAKSDAICDQISTSFDNKPTDIHRAKSMASATRSLYESQFDLIIMDLMIPDRDEQGKPRDVSENSLAPSQIPL
jgi:DNA-binding response OmpR family regulator